MSDKEINKWEDLPEPIDGIIYLESGSTYSPNIDIGNNQLSVIKKNKALIRKLKEGEDNASRT